MKIKQIFTTGLLVCTVSLCLIVSATIARAGQSEEFDSIYTEEISMIKGELVTVDVHSMTRVSITDPKIADVVDADPNEWKGGDIALLIDDVAQIEHDTADVDGGP